MPLLCPRACHLCPGPIICYNRHATYAQDRLFAIMGMPLMPRTDNCARLPSLYVCPDRLQNLIEKWEVRKKILTAVSYLYFL